MTRLLLGCALFAAVTVTLAFLALPVIAIFTHVPPGELIDQLSNPVVHDALIVSLKTTLVAQALILLFGTPTAYVLATRALVDGWTIAIAVATFAVLSRWKVSELWLIAASAALGIVLRGV